MSLDSQYGVCFRSCLSHMLDVMRARKFRDTLNIVIERGHPNVYDCERIFNDMKQRLRRLGVNVLGSFTIESKQTCQPLAAPDFLAGSYSMLRAEHGTGLREYLEVAPKAVKGETGLTYLALLPGSLQKLKSDFERMRQRDIELWRERKKAKKLSGGKSS